MSYYWVQQQENAKAKKLVDETMDRLKKSPPPPGWTMKHLPDLETIVYTAPKGWLTELHVAPAGEGITNLDGWKAVGTINPGTRVEFTVDKDFENRAVAKTAVELDTERFHTAMSMHLFADSLLQRNVEKRMQVIAAAEKAVRPWMLRLQTQRTLTTSQAKTIGLQSKAVAEANDTVRRLRAVLNAAHGEDTVDAVRRLKQKFEETATTRQGSIDRTVMQNLTTRLETSERLSKERQSIIDQLLNDKAELKEKIDHVKRDIEACDRDLREQHNAHGKVRRALGATWDKTTVEAAEMAKADLAAKDGVIAAMEGVMKDVREALGVIQGESTLDAAKRVYAMTLNPFSASTREEEQSQIIRGLQRKVEELTKMKQSRDVIIARVRDLNKNAQLASLEIEGLTRP